ncbi:hypothetical protein Catovirus_2_59 [Catovirus CTV1]|uniref:Uncharacterized protein n=1 Tax=Catovirus CTV1 TaxID=1977631 RepID=A0A1V0SBK2_9VIRU|nr:hypothetical protein Catovirus_2_59 [Catovirus CTV1]
MKNCTPSLESFSSTQNMSNQYATVPNGQNNNNPNNFKKNFFFKSAPLGNSNVQDSTNYNDPNINNTNNFKRNFFYKTTPINYTAPLNYSTTFKKEPFVDINTTPAYTWLILFFIVICVAMLFIHYTNKK